MTLDDEDIEAIAARVAELVEQRSGSRRPPRLATASEVAESLGVGRGWVYANKKRLRGVRLGSGPKAPLRFDLDQATELFRKETDQAVPSEARRSVRSSARLPAGVELIRGRSRQ